MTQVEKYLSVDKALMNFANIKSSIQGLFDLIKISFSEKDIYFDMGLDNIQALYQNFLELMVNEEGVKKFCQKLRANEIDVDIPLGSTITYEK